MMVGDIVTNRTALESGQERRFKVIAEDGDMSWVKALNGNFRGERLTFRTADLSAARNEKAR